MGIRAGGLVVLATACTALGAVAATPANAVSDRFFGDDAVWNVPLKANARLDPADRALSAELRRQVDEGNRSSGSRPTINTTAYSTPVYTAAAGAPTTRVILDQPAGLAPDLQTAFDAVPLPPGAQPAAGTDAQLVVWQPWADTLWEFWKLRKASDGWHASWGGRLDHVSVGPGHFDGQRANWGATGTSLPLAGGLITAAELERGAVDHALALTLPRTRADEFSLPAQRTDGESRSSAAIPEGARFRIDPSLDLGTLGLPPATLAIARAAQRYGMIVRDRGGAVALYAEDPGPLASNPYPALFGGKSAADALKRFPWNRLQLLRMDVRREPGSPSAAPVVCGLLPCP